MGALKWGLKATICNLCTIVYSCTHLCLFWGHNCEGNFRRKDDHNCGQSWTIVDKYPKPPFAKLTFACFIPKEIKCNHLWLHGGSLFIPPIDQRQN